MGNPIFGKLLGGLVGGAVGGPAGASVGSQVGGALGGNSGSNPSADGQPSGDLKSGIKNMIAGSKGTGAVGNIAFGAGQALAGFLKKKKGEEMTPMAESPMERQMLSTIQRRRKALQSGTAYNSQLSANKQLGKTLMTNSMRAGGTPNFGQYNQLIGNAAKEIAAQYGGQLNQLLGAEQQQTTSMANRATDIQLLQRSQLMADAANLQKDGTSNLLAALGSGKMKSQNDQLNSSNSALQTQLASQNQIIKALQAQLSGLNTQTGTQTP